MQNLIQSELFVPIIGLGQQKKSDMAVSIQKAIS